VDVLIKIALVASGSALGGLARWGVAMGVQRFAGPLFPWGTFLINITGSFFLGWFITLLTHRLPEEGYGGLSLDQLRLLVAVGFTGAYTTFSTFEFESHRLLHDGYNLLGWLYIIGSVVLGLIAVRMGILLAMK
jgi:CrcB protein